MAASRGEPSGARERGGDDDGGRNGVAPPPPSPRGRCEAAEGDDIEMAGVGAGRV